MILCHLKINQMTMSFNITVTEGGSFTGIGTAISRRPKCKYSTKEAYIRTSPEF